MIVFGVLSFFLFNKSRNPYFQKKRRKKNDSIMVKLLRLYNLLKYFPYNFEIRTLK